MTYVREPAFPGAPPREIEEEVYAQPENIILGSLIDLTVAPAIASRLTYNRDERLKSTIFIIIVVVIVNFFLKIHNRL